MYEKINDIIDMQAELWADITLGVIGKEEGQAQMAALQSKLNILQAAEGTKDCCPECVGGCKVCPFNRN